MIRESFDNTKVGIENAGRTLGTCSSHEHLGIAADTNRSASEYAAEKQRISELPEFNKLDFLYQFAINYRDPSLQNRLRHSEDVAQVAIDVSRRLGLSEASAQLAGAVALAHDIGHPPFSHWGEKAINARLKQAGESWNHDSFGLSILMGFKDGFGAGLSIETIEGVAKRFWRFNPNDPLGRSNHSIEDLPAAVLEMDRSTKGGMCLGTFNHLEGQIAAQADIVSFNATDIQDGLRIGRLTPEMLREHFPIAHTAYSEILKALADAYRSHTGKYIPGELIEKAIVSNPELHGIVFGQFAEKFRERLVSDLVAITSMNLVRGVESGRLRNADDIRNQDALIVNFSPDLQKQMGAFQAFCRKEVYAKKTAAFEPIVDVVIEKLLTEAIGMPKPYDQRLKAAESQAGKVRVVAEYLVREIGDRDLLLLAQKHAPEVYQRHFPGYEVVSCTALSPAEAFERITRGVSPQDRLGGAAGMPVIHASELDFRPGHSIPVVSSTRKYVLPVPEVGETIQIPYEGKKRSGESFHTGEPIFDWRGSPVSGKGVVFFNSDDDQWVAAPCGLEGPKRSVFIVNEVSAVQARQLDAKRSTWNDVNNPSLEEMKEILTFAASMHIIDGISSEQSVQLMNFIEDCVGCGIDIKGLVAQTPEFLLTHGIVSSASDWQLEIFEKELVMLSPEGAPTRGAIIGAMNAAYGGLRNIFPSSCASVTKSLPGISGYLDGADSLYGYRMRDRSEIFRAVYIDHPFEFAGWEGNPERSYGGAVVIQRNSDVGICQNFRAVQSYEHPDGRKLKIEDIPIQRRSFRDRYQTTHNVQRDITTTVTLVGAGVSGLAAAVHLIKNFPREHLVSHELKLNLIDSAIEPAGSTYNRPDANIVGMANSIGVLGIDHVGGCVEYFNRDPERWMETFPPLRDGFDPITRRFEPSTIITHNQYGEFVKEFFSHVLRELEQHNVPVEVNFIQDKVISTNGKTVYLKSGGQLDADALVYCVGNALPKPMAHADGPSKKLEGISGYHRLDDQAWSLGNINESQSTVVLGTANGALFGALWAVGNGYTGNFTLVSSSGTVPERAGAAVPYDRHYLTPAYIGSRIAEGKELTSDGLKSLFLRELVRARGLGRDWRDVVDSLAPDTNAIWAYLSKDEQAVFQRKYMPAWNNARYRIPDHHWSEIQKLQEVGRLEIVGGLRGITALEKGGFEVTVTNPDGSERTIHATKIVNNTGPSKRVEEMPDCIRQLISDGGARLHHISGLDVDRQFRLSNREGVVQEGVYAIGPIVSGAHPESITVPAIREGASILAHSIINDVVMTRERDYRQKLAVLELQFERPTRAEVQEYVRYMIDQGVAGDPRNPNDPEVISTEKIYFREHGPAGTVYSETRERLHAEIVARALAGKSPVPKTQRPSFVSVAGGMSVGMTYLQRLLMAEGVLDPQHTVIITPLSFIGIHEFDVRDHYQHTEKSPLMCDEYYDIVRKIVTQAIDLRMNVLWVDQADAREPLLSLVQAAQAQQYESAILALTMTPEAYYAASELWLHKFNRIPDHLRGFGDLKEFADNWTVFAAHFDQAELYETYFNTGDIDKSTDDLTRREYTIRHIVSAHRDPAGQVKQIMLEPDRYFDFIDRGRFINPQSSSPVEARRDFPYSDFRQLDQSTSTSSIAPTVISDYATDSLRNKLNAFQAGSFEEKFVNLVRKTSQDRAARAKNQ